jgi:hypothetical protein
MDAVRKKSILTGNRMSTKEGRDRQDADVGGEVREKATKVLVFCPLQQKSLECSEKAVVLWPSTGIPGDTSQEHNSSALGRNVEMRNRFCVGTVPPKSRQKWV